MRKREEILGDLHKIEKEFRDARAKSTITPDLMEKMEKAHKTYNDELRECDARAKADEELNKRIEALGKEFSRQKAEDNTVIPVGTVDDPDITRSKLSHDAFFSGAGFLDGEMPEVAVNLNSSRAFARAFFYREQEQFTEETQEALRYLVNCRSSRGMNLDGLQERQITAGAGTTTGGNAVPEDTSMYAILTKEMSAYMGVEQVARVITTPNGRALPWPTIDDTATNFAGADQTAQRPLEGVAMSAPAEFTFNKVTFNAHVFSSGAVPVTRQAIEDFGPSVGSFLYPLMAERVGRLKAYEFVNGNGGTNRCRGIVPAAAAANAAHNITWKRGGTEPGIQDAEQMWAKLQHAVDIAYRTGPGSAIVMSDAFLFLLKTVSDNEGRPIYPELSMQSWMGRERVGAFRIVVDPNYPGLPTNYRGANGTATPVTIGDHRSFIIRKVRGLWMVRDDLTKANEHEIVYYLSERCDSDLIRANAVRKITFESVA